MPSMILELNSDDLFGGDGLPPGANYCLDINHTITKLYCSTQSTKTGEAKINICIGDKLNGIFGKDLTFALLADKEKTRVYRSMWGTHMKEWLNVIDPSVKCEQTNNGEQPLYNSTDGAVRFPTSDYMTVPTSPFSFGSTEEFSIFMATHTISAPFNAVYLFGGDNSSSSTALSVYGMESARKTIRDQSGNTDQSTSDVPASTEIRCISRRSNGTIDEWVDGVQVETALSGLSGDFDFKYINAAKDRQGNLIQGGTWYVHEILVYETAVNDMGSGEDVFGNTTNIREQIEGYLAHKWSLTGGLPSTHPYKSADPRGTNYNSVVITGGVDVTDSSNGYQKFDTSSPPSFSTADSDWTISGTLSQSVNANERVRIFFEDRSDVGRCEIKVDYTVP